MVLIEMQGVASPRRVAEDLRGSRFHIEVDGPKLVVSVVSDRRDELARLAAAWEREGVVRHARLVA
jgi:hypothetical protein